MKRTLSAAKLDSAIARLIAGRSVPTRNILNGLINEVSALKGKQPSDEHADGITEIVEKGLQRL